MIIKGRKVVLRGIEEEDLELLKGMINDPDMEQLVCGWSYPISSAQQKEWFARLPYDKSCLRTIIDLPGTGPIGYAAIMDINWKNRTCSVGLKILQRNHGIKGLGYDVIMALMRYAFDELQLNHIEAKIVDFNTKSKNLFIDRLGWTKEGLKRQFIYSGGKYHDLIICSILRDEYIGLIEHTDYWNDNNLLK